MPLYGSVEGVMQLLRADPDVVYDADETARITNLVSVASLYIEEQTHSVFTDTPVAEQKEVFGQGDSLLRLCMGIRSVTEVLENPTVFDGTLWSGGTSIPATAYRLQGRVDQRFSDIAHDLLYFDLRRISGTWLGRYVITGVWQDQYPTVPDDIVYWANRLAAEIYKQEKASPHGTMGVDGTQVAIRSIEKIAELVAIRQKYLNPVYQYG